MHVLGLRLGGILKRKYYFIPATFTLFYLLPFFCALLITSCASWETRSTEPARVSAAEADREAIGGSAHEAAAEAAGELNVEAPREPTAETAGVPVIEAAPEPAAEKAEQAPMSRPNPAHKTISTKKQKYKEYNAVLAADPTIKIPGPPGRLRVWIGIPDYKPNFPAGMTQASGALPALGITAQITPFAPAFEVDPKESVCMQIHPTGSEVGFSLTPKDEGTFDVGADVRLYDSDNCSGAPIPKGTTTLQVKVVVDNIKKREEQTKKFWDALWENLLKFWGELLALIFAVILFLIRKQLKKWIGFGSGN